MSDSAALDELARAASTCTGCVLSETRTNVVFGVGSPTARLVIVGEAPGAEEDRRGEPFVGRSGRLLDTLIAEELELSRSEIYIVNTVKCRPPGNRDPKPDELAACRGFLVGQLAAVAPAVLLTVGNFATRAVLDRTEGITKLRGSSYATELCAAPVVPTFHPAAALRGGPTVVAQMRADLIRAKRYL